MQMKPDHVIDSFRLGVIVVVTTAKSYDVLVGGVVLYPMGFQMDYWTETTTYRPSWQFGDGWMSQMPARFILGVRPGASPPKVLASIAGFSGMVTWLGELLEGNISAIDTPVYEDIKEVSSFVAIVPSSLDVPLWRSNGVLRQDADRLVSQAWHEAFVPVEEEEVPQWTPISGPVGLSPLDTTPIAWEYPSEGICMLDLFGGISTGLATMFQTSILVRKYLYVERDETTKRVLSCHLALLMWRYPELLSRSAIRRYQQALPSDIALLGAQNLARVSPINLVITGWPCQGHTRASRGEGLCDP